MTNKKPGACKSAPVHQSAKLDAATLRNMAHQSASSAADNDTDGAVLQSIAGMLAKLSPSNLKLVQNIVQCVFAEQDAASG